MYHSSIPPSSLSRTIKCPWSLTACYERNTTNDAAAEGTTAHWGCEVVLNSYKTPGATPIILSNMVGEVCPDTGMVFTEDMAEYCRVYVNYILKIVNNTGTLQNMLVEERVDIPMIHEGCWGTLDNGIYIPQHQTLIICDLKYGYRYVEPVENIQLMAYASGLISKYGLPPETKVTLVIAQPRPYHRLGPIREWHTTAGEIRPYINTAHNAVSEALNGNARANTGSHCQYCARLPDCPAAQQASYNAIQVTMQNFDTVEYLPENLAQCLDNLEQAEEIIKMRTDALRELAKKQVKEGVTIPGYEIRETFGRPVWTKSEDEVKAFGNVMGVGLTKESLMSPSEAKKAGVPDELVKKLTTRQSKGLSLKRTDNSLAKIIFSKR